MLNEERLSLVNRGCLNSGILALPSLSRSRMADYPQAEALARGTYGHCFTQKSK
jgi:hypothetical protein